MRPITPCAVLALAAGFLWRTVAIQPATGDSAALSRPILRVRKTAEPVSVNGILSEWGFADTVRFVPTEERDLASGNRVTAMAQWDSAKIYVAFRVHDTQINAAQVEDHTSVWLDDCVEVYLSTAPAEAMELGLSLSEYQFVVNPNGAHCTVRGTKYATGLEENSRDFSWRADIADGARVEGTLNDNSDTDTGYTVEMAIPWDAVGLRPKAGDTLLADFCVEDRDSGGAFYSFDWAGLQGFDQPARWGRIVLEDGGNVVEQTEVASNRWAWSGSLALLALGAMVVALIAAWPRGRPRMKISVRHGLLQHGQQSSAAARDARYRVERLLETEYGNEITTADVAGRLGLSERHFQRLLREAAGKPFRDFLTDFRLQKAGQLLAATDKPVTQICFDVGFGDYSHFARVFKKAFGCSPLEYRRRSGSRPA